MKSIFAKSQTEILAILWIFGGFYGIKWLNWMQFNGGRGSAPGEGLGDPRAILAIENTNKYVAINMQLMYNFAEIYEN